MPMQSKIGDASLKFGPDWLRALSSEGGSSPSENGPDRTIGWGPGNGRGGGTSYRERISQTGQNSHSSAPHCPHDLHSQPQPWSHKDKHSCSYADTDALTPKFKNAEHQYSREEMLALYDKNLLPPDYLSPFKTLCSGKIQLPLSFSQLTEDEIKIWHSPQPEASRSNGPPPIAISRGSYSGRGRGIGERGRGRGRGYFSRIPDEEDRGGYSRVRSFERSQSLHEKPWIERNGYNNQGNDDRGGSWRNRDSFQNNRRNEDDEGWRSTKWRRDDDEECASPRVSHNRRSHKSFSEEDSIDNLPEWAKDNPCEESGTFDSSGAFHEDEKGKERAATADSSFTSDTKEKNTIKSETNGSRSHSETVQKLVIEEKLNVEKKHESFPEKDMSSSNDSDVLLSSRLDMSHKNGSLNIEAECSTFSSQELKKHKHPGHNQKEQSEATPQINRVSESDSSSNPSCSQSFKDDFTKPIEINQTSSPSFQNLTSRNRTESEDDPLKCMNEEADNLVSQLIGEFSAFSTPLIQANPVISSLPSSTPNPILPRIESSSQVDRAVMSLGGLDVPPTLPAPIGPITTSKIPPSSHISMEAWLYMDPQGSIQGPFTSHEMNQWHAQGYFTGNLLLRRECDQTFITLSEMAKLYGRNPFLGIPASGAALPPPIPDSNRNSNPSRSALEDYHRQIMQQTMLLDRKLSSEMQTVRSQIQDSLTPAASCWIKPNHVVNPNLATDLNKSFPMNPGSESSFNIQNRGQDRTVSGFPKPNEHLLDSKATPIQHLQDLFNQPTQVKKSEPINIMKTDIFKASQSHSTMPGQPSIAPTDSPPVNREADPIQSLFQQLTSLTNTQVNSSQTHSSSKEWNNSWNNTRWGYRNDTCGNPVAKDEANLRKNEEIRQMEIESEEKEKKRKQEEQYLLRKKQEEEAIARQNEIARQNLIQQQKMHQLEQQKREQQRRLEFQRNEEIRLEKARCEQQKSEEQLLEQKNAEIQRQKLQKEEEERKEKALREQELFEQQQALEEQRRMEKEELEKHEQALKEERQKELELIMSRHVTKPFSWSSGGGSQDKSNPPVNLVEIQQEEVRIQKEESAKRELIKKKQQEEQLRIMQQNKSSSSFTWAQSNSPSSNVTVKSLTEIQAEEQAKLENQKKKDREQRALFQHQVQQHQAWSSSLSWADRASLQSSSNSNSNSKPTVWDGKVNPSIGSNNNNHASNNKIMSHHQLKKSTRDMESNEDSFMKLFQVQQTISPSKPMNTKEETDEFTKWCYQSLKQIGGSSVDVPTFIGFLKEVESPYDVTDYIRSYLGDSREAKEFGKEFLERRSKWKSKNERRDGANTEDNLCRPASAINPNQNEFQEVKVKGKKGKKGKMQKVDSKNLGFI